MATPGIKSPGSKPPGSKPPGSKSPGNKTPGSKNSGSKTTGKKTTKKTAKKSAKRSSAQKGAKTKQAPLTTISPSDARKISRDKGNLLVEVFATSKTEATAAAKLEKCKAKHGERALPIIDDDGQFVIAYLVEKPSEPSATNEAPPRVDGEALAEHARANRRATAEKDKAKASSTKKKKAKAAKSKDTRAKQPGGLDFAAKVLADAKEPLNAKAIAERAIAAGWKTSGATPHATLYAAMIREIRDKGDDARFRKADRGLFASNTSGKKGA